MTLAAEKKAYSPIFTEKEISLIDLHKVPQHLAIVMDGNRRWATLNNLPIEFGHVKGSGQLKLIVQAALELKIKTLTVYSFSTENRQRSHKEVECLFKLFKEYLIEEREHMLENGIALHSIGDVSFFPLDIQQALEETKNMTKKGNRLNLVVAMNYGARDEITRAVKQITQDCLNQKIDPSNINEDLISKYLDTAPFSDPDLLIRTSGEFRLSNFLLWQISYSELSIVKKFWPDFEPIDLLREIKHFQEREIRRGI